MPDGGPVYCETDPSRFPVEPWATYSEIGFFAVVLIWAVRLRGRWREHRFFLFALPVMFLGTCGGVLFHAFRTSHVYFLMDVVPLIVLLHAMVGYLFHRVVPSVWLAAAYVIGVYALNRVLFATIDSRVVAIATSYGAFALAMALPVLAELRRRRWRGGRDVAIAVGFVGLGTWLHRKDLDWCDALPMGTLGFWHLCAAVGIHHLIRFLVATDAKEGAARSAAPL